MSSANLYQSRPIPLDPGQVLKQVIYKPKLVGLGTAQGAWTPPHYFNGNKATITLSMDEINAVTPVTVYDSVFPTAGIRSKETKIRIDPCVLELHENYYMESNVRDVLPQLFTNLNMAFDRFNARSLKSLAPTTPVTTAWKDPKTLMGYLIGALNDYPTDVVKTVVLSKELHTAIVGYGFLMHGQGWYQGFVQTLAGLKTTVIVCDMLSCLETTDKSTGFFIIDGSQLSEYQGRLPEVDKLAIVDDVRVLKWSRIRSSTSDWHLGYPKAVVYVSVTAVDLAKLNATS